MKVKDFIKQIKGVMRLEVAEYDMLYKMYEVLEVYTGTSKDLASVSDPETQPFSSLTPMQESFLECDMKNIEVYTYKNNDFSCACLRRVVGY